MRNDGCSIHVAGQIADDVGVAFENTDRLPGHYCGSATRWMLSPSARFPVIFTAPRMPAATGFCWRVKIPVNVSAAQERTEGASLGVRPTRRSTPVTLIPHGAVP